MTIANIFQRTIAILKRMHDANPSWGPLFVTHPGSIYRDFTYVRPRRAESRTIGRKSGAGLRAHHPVPAASCDQLPGRRGGWHDVTITLACAGETASDLTVMIAGKQAWLNKADCDRGWPGQGLGDGAAGSPAGIDGRVRATGRLSQPAPAGHPGFSPLET